MYISFYYYKRNWISVEIREGIQLSYVVMVSTVSFYLYETRLCDINNQSNESQNIAKRIINDIIYLNLYCYILTYIHIR